MAKLGGFFKEGGAVKLAEGGYAEISDKVRSDPTKYSEAQIQQAVKNGVLDPETAQIALIQIARAKQATSGIDVLPSGLPTQDYAPGGIVAFDDGGEVQRYQSGELVQSSPFSRGLQDWATQARENVQASRLREALRNQYGYKAAPIGVFMEQSDAEREAAQKIISALPKLSLGQMQRLQNEGPAALSTILNLEPSPQQAEAAIPALTTAQRVDTGSDETPAPGGGYFSGIGGAKPAGATVAEQPSMTMDRILERAQAAGARAVPAGLASLTMPTFTPAQMQEKYREAMPKGDAAIQNELTSKFQELETQRKSAAQEAFDESGKISDRMDKLREAQAARFQAKEKDITADRDRSVGIAFLEAAQAMATPGQSLVRSLVTSGVTGAKSFMASKERLDKRADELSDAVNRLDEARVGDARERAAAKANLNQALVNARTDMIRHNETALGMNRSDAQKAVDASLGRDAAAATFSLNKQKAVLDAQQNAEANAIRAAGVGIQALGVEAERARAMRPGAQLELALALGDGDAKKGMQIIAQAQQEKVSPQKMYIDLTKDWDPLKRGRPAPSYTEFLSMMNMTVGGNPSAGSILPRRD